MEPLAAPILEDHPSVDRLISVEQSLSSRLRLVFELRRERFDVAFNMHGGTTATIIARLSGAPWTVGYRGHPKSWLLTARAPSPDVILGRKAVHSVEQQLALLHWSGVPWPASRPQLSLVVSDEASESVREKLAACGLEPTAFAAIAPAAAFESKRWHAEGFAAVVDHLSKQWNLPSVIIAGPGQEHIASEVARRSRTRPAQVTGLSLKELIAMLSLARAFVGNDSGPMHIAAACGLPVVVVFGSSNSTVWHPWTDSPCRVVAGGRTEYDAANVTEPLKDIIKRIPASDVIVAVDEVLKAATRAADAVYEPRKAR
jgi:ADP-heptose:LPS heptosyltransferase